MRTRGHDVVVRVRDLYGMLLGDRVTIDGEELMLPRDSTVSVDVTGGSAATVTFTVFAASVRFTTAGEDTT